ncbi:C-type lectin domain family 4 member F isoform X3 [Myotis myotis]|uniref:C-type lectin domain family 4 member F n=2 Tax=Myotis myotis TaxID=51298 RepID=A0A7J7U4G2_MYOMY|nr:C-type lectin domain family 4 member F isoform X3 [Myotis myotis]KAF6307715.1 C-type lectin domain family 4 member F [Myotis myotis]
MNGDKVRFCRDNQSVSLHPHGLNSSAVAPAAPKMSRLVLASLVFMVMIIATSLMALFVVVLQKPRPAPEAYAYSRGFLGDNSTWQLPVEPNNPYRFGVAELQETLQMFKDHVENSSTWTMEIQMLMCRVDNVSSQIQMLGGHLKNASADIQMVLNDQLENASREIQILKQGMKDAEALNSKTRMLESKLQEANVEVERLKGELASTKALTAKVQEQQRSLETLRAAFASQEQLQKSQNELLQLILQGWKVYNGDMYYFSHVKKSWQEAEKSCVSQGAHLASVTSAEEQAYLTEFTRSSNYWIGLNDRGTEGSWRWIDGTPFNYARSRVFWNDNQPDNWQHGNGQDEDCVHVQQKWNDNNCNALYQWICKKPLSQGVA